MIIKPFDNAEDFFKQIPLEIGENLKFRIKLHELLTGNLKGQEIFLQLCRDYLPIWFNTVAWTLNPQKKAGERNRPFILRPAQVPAVLTLDDCLDIGKDVGINKTRKQGASELCCKIFTAKCLLEPDAHFILGSRKKELVDNFGDPYTLFAKVDNVMECLPTWWKIRSGYDPNKNRKDMNIIIPETGSSMTGETTNESFSAGSRATGLLLDEFGRVDYTIAEAIEGSVHDVCNCIIYSSTHWLGVNHTFNKVIHKPTTELVSLLWYDNPEERAGLYETPKPGQIEIIDWDYYRDKFHSLADENVVILSCIEEFDPNSDKIQFVADGLLNYPSPYRSPFFDYENYKRLGNRRDFICNVCAVPHGASDAPFDQVMLEAIRKKDIRPPDFRGELFFSDNPMEGEVEVYWDYGQRRLEWWGELPFRRPNQRHNYIFGVDPSYGLGSANSAIMITDVNTGEQVGSWADSNTKPEELADISVALASWVGGVDWPFIIWESNAGCGQNFGNRLDYWGYPNRYTQRREDSKTRKKVKKWGWASNPNSKEKLLSELAVALSAGLTTKKKSVSEWRCLIIHDEELLDELADYVFNEKGKGIVASSKADLSTGAAERHGDRGIAMGLCVLGMKEQIEGSVPSPNRIPKGSFEYYRQQYEEQKQREKKDSKRFLF